MELLEEETWNFRKKGFAMNYAFFYEENYQKIISHQEVGTKGCYHMLNAHIPASAHDKRNCYQQQEIGKPRQSSPAIFLPPGNLSSQKSTRHTGDHIDEDNPHCDCSRPDIHPKHETGKN